MARGMRAVAHQTGVALVFAVYAAALVTASRWIGPRVLADGWPARLLTLGLIALGLLPWGRWLRPRIAVALGWLGRAVLVACYFTVLVPFAVIVRLGRDPLDAKASPGASRWVPRRPLPDTLDAARLEH